MNSSPDFSKKVYFFFGIAAQKFNYDWLFRPFPREVNLDSPWTRPWPTIGSPRPSIEVGEKQKEGE